MLARGRANGTGRAAWVEPSSPQAHGSNSANLGRFWGLTVRERVIEDGNETKLKRRRANDLEPEDKSELIPLSAHHPMPPHHTATTTVTSFLKGLVEAQAQAQAQAPVPSSCP